MITQPDIQLLHAIDRLSVNSDFQSFIAYLNQVEKVAIQQLLDGAVSVSVHKSQGYVTALRDVVALATTSKDVLSALGQG